MVRAGAAETTVAELQVIERAMVDFSPLLQLQPGANELTYRVEELAD